MRENSAHENSAKPDRHEPMEPVNRNVDDDAMRPEGSPEAPARPLTVLSAIGNAVRGGLIGMAELVPGISGGTVALIVGVYERLIDSGNHLISGIKQLVLGPDRGRWFAEVKRAEWTLIIPLLIGMFVTVFTMAGVMETFVTDHEVTSRALFLGMVAASVIVPLTLIDRDDVATGAQKTKAGLIVGIVAVAFFFITGIGGASTNENPSPVLVFCAAAIAICALILPGVSGSFFLLTIGIYAPTVAAVSDRDLGYMAVFAAGAFLGLASFVKLLHWLLHHHHTTVMLVMAGLMLGSLRALWPWQTEDRGLLAPDENVLTTVLVAVLGAIIVLVLLVADRKLSRRADETITH